MSTSNSNTTRSGTSGRSGSSKTSSKGSRSRSASGSRSTSAGKKSTSRTPGKGRKNQPVPMRREIGAVVCLLLAVFAALGYFSRFEWASGAFIAFFGLFLTMLPQAWTNSSIAPTSGLRAWKP